MSVNFPHIQRQEEEKIVNFVKNKKPDLSGPDLFKVVSWLVEKKYGVAPEKVKKERKKKRSLFWSIWSAVNETSMAVFWDPWSGRRSFAWGTIGWIPSVASNLTEFGARTVALPFKSVIKNQFDISEEEYDEAMDKIGWLGDNVQDEFVEVFGWDPESLAADIGSMVTDFATMILPWWQAKIPATIQKIAQRVPWLMKLLESWANAKKISGFLRGKFPWLTKFFTKTKLGKAIVGWWALWWRGVIETQKASAITEWEEASIGKSALWAGLNVFMWAGAALGRAWANWIQDTFLKQAYSWGIWQKLFNKILRKNSGKWIKEKGSTIKDDNLGEIELQENLDPSKFVFSKTGRFSNVKEWVEKIKDLLEKTWKVVKDKSKLIDVDRDKFISSVKEDIFSQATKWKDAAWIATKQWQQLKNSIDDFVDDTFGLSIDVKSIQSKFDEAAKIMKNKEKELFKGLPRKKVAGKMRVDRSTAEYKQAKKQLNAEMKQVYKDLWIDNKQLKATLSAQSDKGLWDLLEDAQRIWWDEMVENLKTINARLSNSKFENAVKTINAGKWGSIEIITKGAVQKYMDDVLKEAGEDAISPYIKEYWEQKIVEEILDNLVWRKWTSSTMGEIWWLIGGTAGLSLLLEWDVWWATKVLLAGLVMWQLLKKFWQDPDISLKIANTTERYMDTIGQTSSLTQRRILDLAALGITASGDPSIWQEIDLEELFPEITQ